MNKHLSIGGLAGLAFLSILSAQAHAAGASTDANLFGKDPGESKAKACFVRHYTPDHLASHKQQNVKDMLLFVDSYMDDDKNRQYSLSMGVNYRQSSKMFLTSGGCGTMIDGKALSCGIDCDGGHIDVNLKGTDSMLVGIPDGVRIWDPDEDENADENATPEAMWGADDKLFRLDRTDLQNCLPLVADDDVRAEILGTK